MRADDRAVSTTLGYVLALAIATVLISGLLVASGGFVEDQRERVVRTELEVVGHTLAAKIEAADRLASAGGAEAVEVGVQVPDRVGGVTYRIAVNRSGADRVRLTATNPDVAVSLAVATDRSLAASTTPGGPMVVALDDAGELEVRAD